MIQSHKNTDFFHNLPLLVFFFCSDTLARHLAVAWCIHGKVDGSKCSTSETLWGDDISTNSLQGALIEGSTMSCILTLWVGCWGGVGSKIFAFSLGSFQMWTHLNSFIGWSMERYVWVGNVTNVARRESRAYRHPWVLQRSFESYGRWVASRSSRDPRLWINHQTSTMRLRF
jgi:hypothetical protein